VQPLLTSGGTTAIAEAHPSQGVLLKSSPLYAGSAGCVPASPEEASGSLAAQGVSPRSSYLLLELGGAGVRGLELPRQLLRTARSTRSLVHRRLGLEGHERQVSSDMPADWLLTSLQQARYVGGARSFSRISLSLPTHGESFL
jgi:hypothetical protein